MFYLRKPGSFLPHTISYSVLIIKKWRQKSTAYIAVFIDGRIQHYPTIFPVPERIIRTTPKERDAKWRSAYNHQLSLLFYF